jgi:PAS domain S-box-containing protein
MNQLHGTILIIADNRLVAEDLQLLLTSPGLSVMTAASSKEALGVIAAHSPNIIIMDMELYEKRDGAGTVPDVLRNLPIPVVFIADHVDRARLQKAGITRAHGFILKPFDEQEIRLTLGLVLSENTADSELLESRKWLATTLQSIGDAVIATDEKGCVKFMNPVAEHLTGWTQAEATGIPLPEVFDIINQSTRKAVPNPVELVLREGHIVGLANHTILIAKGGSEYHIDDSAAPIHTPNGGIGGVVLTFRDITEKYRIEAAIEANERRFRAMIENNQDMIRLVDATGKLLYISPSAERITGYTIDEFDGHLMLEITHPDDQPDVLKIIDALFAEPAVPLHVQHRIRHKAGHWLWMEGTVTNLLHDPAVGAIVSNIRDITARKEAEDKLRENYALLTAITEGTDDIIFVKDTEGRYMFVNSSISKINSYQPDDMLGKTDLELFPPEQARAIREIDLNILATDTGQIVENTLSIHGSNQTFMTSKNPLRDSEGKVIGVVGISRNISEKIKIQDAIQKNQELFRAMIEDSNNGVVLINNEGHIIYTSPANEKIIGYSAEERLKQSFLDNIHPNDKARAVEYLKELFDGKKKIANFEIQAKHKDGSWRWLEISGSNMLDNPWVNAIVINFHDITRRTVAADELQKSKENLREIVEGITVPMVITSMQTGKVLYGNQLVADLMGVPMETVLQQEAIDFYSNPEDRAVFVALLKKQGFVQNHTMKMRRLTGDEIWVLITARIVTFNGEQALAVTLYDISEEKRAEQQIRDQAAILDLVPDAIIMRDLDHRIISWSKGAEKMYGWTMAESIGTLAPELLGISNAPEFIEAEKNLTTTGEWSGEMRHSTHTGSTILVHSRLKVLYNSSNKPYAILVTNTDITEKKSLEKQLFRAQRLESIGTLASGIAHDLNNILTPVVLGMELIKLKLTDEATRKRVDTVISTVKRGSGLIGQVLSFARGSQENREPINIKYIIDEVAKIARETFPREIEVTLNLPSEDLIVNGNATQLHQIMMNLCINARDAMNEKGGTLSIEAGYLLANESLINRYVDAKPGMYVHILVRDTGTGIPLELQDKIFEPFYTTKEVGKGTGIGLTTVFTIVRNHGGFIGLYSEVNVGTAFSIYLPAELPKPLEQSESSVNPQHALTGTTILLVDDEDLIRNIADDILQAYNYNVYTAKNGAEAVQIYTNKKDEISAVITDVMMPVMGGIELMGILRSINPGVRIIAASGVIDGDSTKNLKAAGAQVILLKPFTVDKMLAAIQEVLE